MGILTILTIAFIYYMLTKTRSASYKRIWFYGFTVGFIYFLVHFGWLWSLYPLETFGLHSTFAAGLIVALIWLTHAAILALFWTGCACAWKWIPTPKTLPLGTLATSAGAASIFILFEFARSYVVSIFWFGQGAVVGPHWTFGNLAYYFSSSDVALFLSSLGGIYLVEWVIVLLGIILALTFINKNTPQRAWRLGVWIALIILFSVLPLHRNTKGPLQSYTVIQTQHLHKSTNSQEIIEEGFKTKLSLVIKSLETAKPGEIILLPEAAKFLRQLDSFLPEDSEGNFYRKLQQGPEILLVDNFATQTEAEVASRTLFFNSKHGPVGYVDKTLLMPLGEFLPLPVDYVLQTFAPNLRKLFIQDRQLLTGGKSQDTSFNGVSLEAAICSDLVSASIIRNKAQHAEVILAQTSGSIFHGNPWEARQTLAMNRFRAAENNIPVVVATNYGPSYAIDATGEIAAISDDAAPQTLSISLASPERRSLYTKLGDWPIVVSALYLAGIAFIHLKKKTSV